MEENKTERHLKIEEDLEAYFQQFRKNTIGMDYEFISDYGTQKLLYADWIASGRLYRPIEDVICNEVGPFMANTHSFSSESGKASTYAYNHARQLIKGHINAEAGDILVTTGSGMTGALAKLLRIMGLKKKKQNPRNRTVNQRERPVIFISHMEHHSNQVPWAELDADVVILKPDGQNNVNLKTLEQELEKYKDRKIKIGSFTACSNVTGIITPYYEMAEILHNYNGLCFIDFAASAPYVTINMHPKDKNQKLDAVFFSPHKFLGGPGTCGVLCFDQKLYKRSAPDNPGGGNVKWTDPWGGYSYHKNIETKEDGGTPGILQVIRTALCLKLKEKMDPNKMRTREQQLLNLFYERISGFPQIRMLGDKVSERIGCVSINVKGIHYNLIVRLLNDRFGIQVRGGWSCASSFAHYLFCIKPKASKKLMQEIERDNLSEKPGWVRISFHPIMSDAEVIFIADAIAAITVNIKIWSKDYQYNRETNEFESIGKNDFQLLKRMEAVFN